MTALATDKTIGVIGAGTMGAGIAQVAAAAGHRVLLLDVQPGVADKAITGIDGLLEKRVAKGKMAADDKVALVGRITACTELGELAPASLVVEAIVEKLEVKRQVFRELEGIVAPEAILASNTSSISITAIGAGLERPERLVGMHFFNPAPLMALVEVVSGLATGSEVAQTVFDTAAAWGKSPVLARSTPGFIVNRVARPFYAEALRVLQEGGGDPATLDGVMRESGGFRMGPFELTDLIGQDVNYSVTRSVFEAYYQDPRFTPSLIQQELVAAGFLGRKSGRGFYSYGEGQTRPEPRTAPPAERPDKVVARGRLGPLEALLPLLQEAGITVERASTEGHGRLEIDDRLTLALTDGRTATQRMEEEDALPLVLVDLALDYAKASRVALARADQPPPAVLEVAVGLFQAIGKQVSILDDVPGMIVMRTVAMLANEGADAVNQQVCDAQAVDTAMCKGVNYPRGPLVWAQQLGLGTVIDVLDNLAASYGEDRYRVSPLLRRKYYAGGDLL